MVRNVIIDDAPAICEIYNHYILNSISTFQESEMNVEEMENRIKSTYPDLPWVVYIEYGQVLGYAYATRWKPRNAYRYSVESSVYLAPGNEGKSIGSQLYKELVAQLRKKNFHAVIGGIALPNDASIALHEKFGFEKIAHFREVGYKFEKWIDVGYWELILDS